MKKHIRPAILLLLTLLAHEACANLVQDGDFTNVVNTPGTTGLTTLYGQFGTGYLTVTGWTTTGYNFVYAPNTADIGTQAAGANSGQPKEAPGQATVGGYGNTYLWGPNNGSANGLLETNPLGGNYIAMDGAYEVGAVSQTITGLTIGQTYALTFAWAGAQQQAYTGTTTDMLTVTLGTNSQSTSVISVASEGFTVGGLQTFFYTATGTSEVLSFLATGAPNGEPPFTLLGNVDLEVVPDYSNWLAYTLFGAACISLESFRRKRLRISRELC